MFIQRRGSKALCARFRDCILVPQFFDSTEATFCDRHNPFDVLRLLALDPRLQISSAIDSNGRTIWIGDARRGDGKRFVVRADELLTAFVELESQLAVKGWISRKGVFRACGGMYD